MKSRFFGLFALLLALTFAFIACSDNSTDNNLTEGDYNDPNYERAQATTENIVNSFFEDADATSDYIGFNGSEPMQACDSLLITFDQETCWWHLYLDLGSDTSNSGMLIVDSVKFQDAQGCQQFPDSFTTTSIEYRALLDIDIVADSGTFMENASENILLEGIQEDTCVINATAVCEMDIIANLYELAYDYEGAMDDIKFLTQELMYEENPRPVAGTLYLDLTIYGSNQQGSGSWHWSITITFGEGGYHARAESGENYWEWDFTYVS